MALCHSLSKKRCNIWITFWNLQCHWFIALHFVCKLRSNSVGSDLSCFIFHTCSIHTMADIKTCYFWPRGLRDKVSDFESGDFQFESCSQLSFLFTKFICDSVSSTTNTFRIPTIYQTCAKHFTVWPWWGLKIQPSDLKSHTLPLCQSQLIILEIVLTRKLNTVSYPAIDYNLNGIVSIFTTLEM